MAAVCSERHGVFERMHEALLTEDDWLTDKHWNWPHWVPRLGVQDTASFQRCMAAQDTVVFWVPPRSTVLPDGVTRPNGQVMGFSATGPGRKIVEVLQQEIGGCTRGSDVYED